MIAMTDIKRTYIDGNGAWKNKPVCPGCRNHRVAKPGETKCSFCRAKDNYKTRRRGRRER